MKLSHYAPLATVKLFENRGALSSYEKQCVSNKTSFATILGSEDRELYARELYSSLRDADALQPKEILVLLPEPIGIGVAIRDRLFKAAAPH
jgi:hypothetical protein